MNSLINIIESITTDVLEHYGDTLKGVIIGGEAIDFNDERKPILVLLVLDKTHKISFYAREEIAEYFIKRIEGKEVYFEFIKKYGHRPLIYFLILDPQELSFHNPIIIYLLAKGKILFDKYKLLEKERTGINVLVYNNLLKIGEINKGEVIEL